MDARGGAPPPSPPPVAHVCSHLLPQVPLPLPPVVPVGLPSVVACKVPISVPSALLPPPPLLPPRLPVLRPLVVVVSVVIVVVLLLALIFFEAVGVVEAPPPLGLGLGILEKKKVPFNVKFLIIRKCCSHQFVPRRRRQFLASHVEGFKFSFPQLCVFLGAKERTSES